MIVSPAALIQTIKLDLLRTPLFHSETVMDLCHLTRAQLMDKIQDGSFAWAFDIGNSKSRAELRILALSVVEHILGPIQPMGATRNLQLPAVFGLIFPNRDLRSTELKRLLHCGSDWFRFAKPSLTITRHPTVTDGPNSYYIVSRASVVDFLAKRRIS